MRRTGKATGTLAAATSLAMLSGGVAFADIIQNTIVGGSAADETVVNGGFVQPGYWIKIEGNDGQAGCNAADTTPLNLTITIPSGVSAESTSFISPKPAGVGGNQERLQITACGTNVGAAQVRRVKFTASALGLHDISTTYSDGGSTATTGTYTNESSFSLTVNPRTASGVSAAAASSSSVTLSWGRSADHGAIQNYEVERTRSGAPTTTILVPATSAAGTSQTYTDTALTASTAYTYRVRAHFKDSADRVFVSDWAGGNAAATATTSAAVVTPIDTTAPAKPTIDLAAASDTGVSATDNKTNDNTPTLEGIAEAGSTVRLLGTDATTAPSATANSAGVWSITPATALADGSYTLTAAATDVAGNTSDASDPLTVAIDTDKPVIDSMTNQSGVATSASGGPVSWTAPGVTEGLTPTCASAGTPALVSGSTFPLGQTAVACNATDVAGNEATAVTFNVLLGYNFGGFTAPVDALPTKNTVKAGRAIPIKFTLGGDMGLAIFGSGSAPSAPLVTCLTGTGDLLSEEVPTASNSSLHYDAATGVYTYVWKTDSTWAGKCRNLNLNLKGAYSTTAKQLQTVQFNFTK